MAAPESAFGEEAVAVINPSLDRENWTATDCSEFQFNTISEQGQLCILEPRITEIVDNEALPINHLTTAEKVALENSVKTESVWEYPWQSDQVVTSLPIPQQHELTSIKGEEANSQSSKQVNYHNNQTKNLHFSDRPKKDFQRPSLFAQNKNVFCANKVPMQSKQLNWEQLEIYNSLMPDQNSQTKNCSIGGDQCGKNNQKLSHLYKYYKNVLPNENSAWQDQNSQSEISSLTSEACYRRTLVPVPLQTENIIEYVDEAVCPNTIQMTDGRTETKNLHICDHCGKEYQWLSELIQHQLLYLGGEADKQDQCRNPSYLAPLPIFLQENSMCSASWGRFQQISRDHNTHAKKLYLCHQSGKDFCRSSVLKWHIVPREELTGQSDSKINKSNTLSVSHHVTGNVFADSCETSTLNSMLANPYTGKYSSKNSVPIPLQAEKTFSENSKILIEQKNYAKNLYTCNCDRNNFQCYCLLAKNHLHVPLGGEADTKEQFIIQAGSLNQFQMESKVIGSSETIKPQSNLTTNQDSHIKSLSVCKECGKNFRWFSALVRHQVVHSGKANGKQCPSKVDDQNDLPPSLMEFDQPSHLKANQVTQKNEAYACGHCGKSFKWPSDLARHKRIHSRKKLMRGKTTKLNKSYICDQCGKNFQWSELAQHKCTHSRKKLPRSKGTKLNKYYTRSQSQKSFQWPSHLVQYEHAHSRRKFMRDQCTKLNKSCIRDECGKSFKWPSELAQHERTHSKSKLVRSQCTTSNKYNTRSQCGKNFQWPSQPAQHEHTHSRSKLVRGKCTKLIKSCICDQCGKSFKYPSDLTRHEHTHFREKKRQASNSTNTTHIVTVEKVSSGLKLPSMNTLIQGAN